MFKKDSKMIEKLKKRSSDDLSELSKILKNDSKIKQILIFVYDGYMMDFDLFCCRFFNFFDSSERSSEERFFSFSFISLSFFNMSIAKKTKKTKKTPPPRELGRLPDSVLQYDF